MSTLVLEVSTPRDWKPYWINLKKNLVDECENDEYQWIEHIENLTQPNGRHPKNHEMISAQMAKEIKEIYYAWSVDTCNRSVDTWSQ